ncbi:CPBP family intramembrane metalloprotease, partial [Candidatus Micrarchaeota archaeon]|nr:CPBP family intramembrane metalloprotease [Candidatus Micrarchaeota archaeon]
MRLLREEITLQHFFAVIFALSVLFLGIFVFFINDYPFTISTYLLHIGFFSFSLVFLWKKTFSDTLKSLGFPGHLITTLKYTFAGLFAVFLISFLISIAADNGGFDDSYKIEETVQGLPFELIVFAVIIAPITEEIFYRAFLTEKIGIWGSATVFGLSHIAYGSYVEVIGAFLIGLLLSFIYRKSKSIT